MARPFLYDEDATSAVVSWDRLLLTGDTEWRRSGPMVKASWDLRDGYPEFDFVLNMQIHRFVPARYSIVLRIERDQPAVRLCVRGAHKNPRAPRAEYDVTHLHDVRQGDREGMIIDPPERPFWRARQSELVTPGEYRENLSAFCNYLRIEVRSFVWRHPHDGDVEIAPTSEEGDDGVP